MARPGRPLLASALVLLASLLVASPAHAVSIAPEAPASPNAESIATTYWVMLAIAAAIVLVINAALAVALIRFRDRRDRRSARTAAGRGALRPAVLGLSAVAIAVFVFGAVMTSEVRDVEATGPDGLNPAQEPTAQVGVGDIPGVLDADPETAPLEIDATAQQWLWRFEYPGGQPGQRTFSYGELVVPVDTTVVLNLRSIDVAHSWWVPALGGQAQALPGSLNQTWFKATEEGRYEGRSTIFSGTGYPSLRAWVRVVPVSEYLAHVAGLGDDLEEAQNAVAGEDESAEAATDAEDGQAEPGAQAEEESP